MARQVDPAFRYSANIRDAVETLLPGHASALREVDTGASLARRLKPIANMRPPVERLLLALRDIPAPDLALADARQTLRRGLARMTVHAAASERDGKPPQLPAGFYPKMDIAVQALRILNKVPSIGESVEQPSH